MGPSCRVLRHQLVLYMRQKPNCAGIWEQNLSTKSEHKIWAQNLSTESEHKIWALNLSTKFEHKIWAQNLSTEFEHRIWAQNLSTKSEHKIWAQNLSTKFEHWIWALESEHKIWARNLSTEFEYGIWAQNLSTKSEHKIWAQNLSTESKHWIWAQNFSTKFEHWIWALNLSTELWSWTSQFLQTLQSPSYPITLSPVHITKVTWSQTQNQEQYSNICAYPTKNVKDTYHRLHQCEPINLPHQCCDVTVTVLKPVCDSSSFTPKPFKRQHLLEQNGYCAYLCCAWCQTHTRQHLSHNNNLSSSHHIRPAPAVSLSVFRKKGSQHPSATQWRFLQVYGWKC